MYITLLDRMIPPLLERQVLNVKDIDLIDDKWPQWIAVPKENIAIEDIIGTFWDPFLQLGFLITPEVPFKSSKDPAPYCHREICDNGNKIKLIDIVITANIAWLFLYLYETPSSLFYHDNLLKQRAIAALDFVARTVLNGSKIYGCFDLGLISFCEAFLLIKDSLDEDKIEVFTKAIKKSAHELTKRIEDEWLVLFENRGEHNHQIITAYSILFSGVILNNQEMIDKGTKELEENIGYLKKGFSNEHDRKYEYFTCMFLLKAVEITGNNKILEAIERSVNYNINLITESGEIVELVSLRPTGSGGGWGYGAACYVYERLAAIKNDSIYKNIAIKIQRYLASKQRKDGLLQGMIYSQEPEQNIGSMCAFFNTGYNLFGLIWADQIHSQIKSTFMDKEIFFLGHEEKIVGYRQGTLSYYACGSDQGSKDIFWIDNKGPAITGFTCLIETGESTKGDWGGFTRNLSIDENYWKVNKNHDEISIFQKMIIKEKGQEFGQARFVTYVSKLHIIIFSWITSDRADFLVSGPNVRASIGSLYYETQKGKTGSFYILKDELEIKGSLNIVAAGRNLYIIPLSLKNNNLILTPAIGRDTPYLHLVSGRCYGVHVKTKGCHQNIIWVITTSPQEEYLLPACETDQMVQAILMPEKHTADLLVVNYEMVEAKVKIIIKFPYASNVIDLKTKQNDNINFELDIVDEQLILLFDGKRNPLLKPKSVMHLKIKLA